MNNKVLFRLYIVAAGLFLISEAFGDDLIISGEAASNGLNVVVSVPEGFADHIEIYACSNLVVGDWRVVTENMRPIGSNPAQWHTDASNVGFFLAGNMDVDSDSDGLPDAREKYVHKTDPQAFDSDTDGLPDGWEAHYNLDPRNKADAMNDPDDDGLNNLEAYQTRPILSESDTDGDGLIDSCDLRVNEFDCPVVGEGVFNLVASWWYLSPVLGNWLGFGSSDEQLLTLRWSANFYYPPRPPSSFGGYLEDGLLVSPGSSQLRWQGIKIPGSNGLELYGRDEYFEDYWFILGLGWGNGPLRPFWQPQLPDGLPYNIDSESRLGIPSELESEIMAYAYSQPSLHCPTNGNGFLYSRSWEEYTYGEGGGVIATQTYYYCIQFSREASEPQPPRTSLEYTDTMVATGGGLQSYGASTFKFVFNQPVTNKTIKWLTYRYCYEDFARGYVDYAVHRCEVTGKESGLFSSDDQHMIVPAVDLNGDFDSDGDVDEADSFLRAPATASLPVVPTEQTNGIPGSGVVPVTIGANVFAPGMPESVLKVKFSGIEPGEHFSLWSTTNIIPEEPFPIMMVVGGGSGRSELIEDPPLLIDTEAGLEHDWPVKNLPSYTPGCDIYAYTYAPEFPKTLYLECVSCGATNDGRAKIELIYEYNGEEICSAALPITVIRSKLVPDWNHDRSIDVTDQNHNTNNAPFRFWINDDNDSGDISEGDSDVPGQGGGWLGFEVANYKDDVVNGRSDLIDFFPVWLDVKSVLERYPVTSGAVYKLRQADGALKFVYTDLAHDTAGDFLIAETNTYGVATNQNAYEADTIQITSSGVTLDAEFINRIAADTNKGVLMMEAVDSSTAPLTLEIWQGDNKVWETSLALSLSGVEDMYRKINLRSMEDAIQQDPPANYPDALSNGKNVVFLHGFSVDEQAARGWHAEMFKRLYQSGSRAMFHAVTWRGDDSGPIDPLYQENVNNAFLTALYLAQYVNDLSGDKILLAHSLGNMVVSSSIQDYGMNAAKYLMLDAAVASEAYDASLFNAATNGNPMLHAHWQGYEPRTWAAKFHELYSLPDMRAKLTWRGRFSSVVSNAYNFYNSDDEVFEINPLSVSMMTGVEFDFNIWLPSSKIHGLDRHAWQKQEVFKGRDYLGPSPIGSTDWWGWGFHDSLLGSAGQANGLSTNELREDPVFGHHPDWYNADNLTTNQVNHMLAMGLPAMSSSAGQTNVARFNPAGQPPRNINISTLKVNGWPRNEAPYLQRWLHSDCKDVAFVYTYGLFDELATRGDLK